MLDRSTRVARRGLALTFSGCFAALCARAAAEESDSTAAPELSLAELQAYAQEHAPALRVARERQRIGTGARAAADAWLPDNPELDLSVGPRWGEGSTTYDFSAGLSQPIEISGGRGARQRAAQRLDEALGAQTALGRFQLRIELASAYRSAQLSRTHLAVATNFVAFVSDTRRIVERRLEAGEATLIELRVAEGDLARAQRDLSLARQSLQVARMRLCELSGWPASAPPLVEASLPGVRAAPNVDRLLEIAVRNHPELRLRRAALSQASAELDVAERAAWSKPAIGAQLIREGSTEDPAEWILLGTLRLPLPLWQQNRAERERGSASRAVAQVEFDTEAETLAVRIRRAAFELEAAAERLQLLAAGGAAFEDSLSLLRRGLEAGEIALLDVSVARERFFASQLAALSARGDYEQAWLELERATGEVFGAEP